MSEEKREPLYCAIVWIGAMSTPHRETLYRAVIRKGGASMSRYGNETTTVLERSSRDGMEQSSWSVVEAWGTPANELQTMVEHLINATGLRPEWDARPTDGCFSAMTIHPTKEYMDAIERDKKKRAEEEAAARPVDPQASVSADC